MSVISIVGIVSTCFFVTQGVALLGVTEGSRALHYAALLAISLQLLVFIHASGLFFGNERTEHFYDLTGASTYITVTCFSIFWRGGIQTLSPKLRILNALVLIWATRLGSFLFYRAQRDDGDSRFVEIKKSLGRFLSVWVIQGVWVFLTALPLFYLNCDQTSIASISETFTPSSLDLLGLSVWIIGFLIEAVADWQKLVFRANPKNKHKFISHGLWSLSRHPNCKRMSSY